MIPWYVQVLDHSVNVKFLLFTAEGIAGGWSLLLPGRAQPAKIAGWLKSTATVVFDQLIACFAPCFHKFRIGT
jgi:hypothetical protein